MAMIAGTVGDTQITLRGHFGDIQITLRGHFGVIQITLRGHFGDIQITLREHVIEILWNVGPARQLARKIEYNIKIFVEQPWHNI
jgi:hypothetical protein